MASSNFTPLMGAFSAPGPKMFYRYHGVPANRTADAQEGALPSPRSHNKQTTSKHQQQVPSLMGTFHYSRAGAELLFAPHFSYLVTEQFSIGHEGDAQMPPNLYNVSLGLETFGGKNPNPKMPFTPCRNFPVLPHANISYTPDFQHSIFLSLRLKRARIPRALNADGL